MQKRGRREKKAEKSIGKGSRCVVCSIVYIYNISIMGRAIKFFNFWSVHPTL